MDSQELPSAQTQQNQAGADQGVARKTRGRPRKEPRSAAAPSDAKPVEKKPSLTIPARPPVQEYTPEDGRKFAVVPARAVIDHQVTRQAFRVLALICMHANRNGFTWIGIQKMADLMGCTTAAIGQQMMELKALGYVEETSAPYYGGPNARTATIRVIYDPTMSAEDVLSRDSGRDEDKWGQVEIRSNIQGLNGVITSSNGEVVNRKQEPTRSDLERLRPALIHEVQERYRREGLPVPIGDRLAREVADLASIKARSGTLLA